MTIIKRKKTYTAKRGSLDSNSHLIDATGQPLGRLASKVAVILQGKDKPTYTPNLLTGDFVVVINAKDIALTGNKIEDKVYYHHSGYPGGLKERSLSKLMETLPENVIYNAVKGMLPKNSLGRQMFKRLKVYPSQEHPHNSQISNG